MVWSLTFDLITFPAVMSIVPFSRRAYISMNVTERIIFAHLLLRNKIKIKIVYNEDSEVGGFIAPAGPDSFPRVRYFFSSELSALDAKRNHRVSCPDLMKV